MADNQMTTNPHGGNHKSEEYIKSDNVTLDNDRGNSNTYALRKFRAKGGLT